MTRPARYLLYCYVCDCGSRTELGATWDGWVTFEQLYIKRPDACRYAVVACADGAIWVMDLFEAFVGPHGYGVALGPYRVFADLDTAVAACCLTYAV